MKGIVYCIKELSTGEIIYVGSTTMPFGQRIYEHKRECFNRIKGTLIYEYMREKSNKESFDNVFAFEIIVEHEYNSKQDLLKEERKYMDKFNPKLNIKRPFRSKNEKKEKMHNWYLSHIESEKERLNNLPKTKSKNSSDNNKRYYLKHKKEISDKMKWYYLEHKEERLQYQKQYYMKNKEN